jgi:hypothetical protein
MNVRVLSEKCHNVGSTVGSVGSRSIRSFVINKRNGSG